MRIIVLLGGDSAEREVSQVSGKAVFEALQRSGHEVLAIDTAGPHAGRPIDFQPRSEVGEAPPPAALVPASQAVRTIERIGTQAYGDVDVVFLALHGGKGEDGTVQALLEFTGVPYTGCGVLSSSIGTDKETAKRIFRDLGVPTPVGFAIDASVSRNEIAERLAREVGYPAICKPNSLGSSVGFSILQSPADLDDAVRLASAYDSRLLLEKYIPGREMTVAVLEDQALPVVEIVPRQGAYDYRNKYTPGMTSYHVPAPIPEKVAGVLQDNALRCFQGLKCRDFARVDFRLSPENESYCLEVNTIPGLTPTSLLPKAAEAAGIGFDALIERLAQLAATRGRSRTPR